MMSTADIIYGKNGNPYAVRKQGAGLANLMNSIDTTAYITTYDENGNAMGKTKLQLGDDKEKTGVYEMTFAVNNFGKKSLDEIKEKIEKLGLELGMNFSEHLMTALEAESVRVRSEVEETK